MDIKLLKELGFHIIYNPANDELSKVFKAMKDEDNLALSCILEFVPYCLKYFYLVKWYDPNKGKEIHMSKWMGESSTTLECDERFQIVYRKDFTVIQFVTDIEFLKNRYPDITERLTFKSPAKSARK